MTKKGILATVLLAGSGMATAHAQDSTGNPYIGLGLESLALDSERVVGIPTRSPSHTSKVISLFGGYRFNDRWSAEVGFGVDASDNVDVDALTVNAYRYFGESRWQPFVSAGLSNFQVDEATLDDDTDQFQLGFGVAGMLSDSMELRVGYQHYHTISGTSYDDDAVSLRLNWHFGQAEPVAMSEPVAVPVAAPAPAPAPVPDKEVTDTYELLVEFDFDKSNIRSVYEPQFREIADKLNGDAEVSMTIEGHTDWVGTDEYNVDLSRRRAEAVRQKFIDDYGFDPQRIDVEAFGESRPKASNETAEGRQRNRRAMAIILKVRQVAE